MYVKTQSRRNTSKKGLTEHGPKSRATVDRRTDRDRRPVGVLHRGRPASGSDVLRRKRNSDESPRRIELRPGDVVEFDWFLGQWHHVTGRVLTIGPEPYPDHRRKCIISFRRGRVAVTVPAYEFKSEFGYENRIKNLRKVA